MQMIPCEMNGMWILNLPEHRQQIWTRKDGWERQRLKSMYQHIIPSDVVYYIGAEEGDMPALIQSWGATVAMFEPDSKVWPNIQAIWKANELETPWCFCGFAANKDTGGKLEHGFPSSSAGPITTDHGFKELAYEGNTIPCQKIDTSVKDTGLIPTVISLDVEGSEFEVLRGAEQTITTYHPKIWLSLHPEFMFHMFGEYSGDLRNWLKKKAYGEQLLEYEHEVHLYYEFDPRLL